MVFHNFLKNVKTLEPKIHITDEISRGPFFRPCAAPQAVVRESGS